MTDTVASGWVTRFKAWWDGYDLPKGRTDGAERDGQAIGAEAVEPVPPAESVEADTGPPAVWSPARIALAEAIWGPDCHTPGDASHIATLFKPFGLNETMSVLDLGAGLGAASRLMAKSTGAWVTGYESDPVLQEAGHGRSVKAGMEQKAPIRPLDWSGLAFDKRYDAVFSRETFFTVRDKQGLIRTLTGAMKPRAHLLFTDYALAEAGEPAGAIAAWRDGEPITPHPIAVGDTVAMLKAAGFDVRTAEDVTESHHEMVVSCWAVLTQTLREKIGDPEIRTLVVDEAELWMRRVAALETGDLRFCRFYALGP